MHTPFRLEQGSSRATSWSVASADISAELLPYVRSLYGYAERTAGGLQRRELPAPQVVVIFELGPSLRVYESGQIKRWQQYTGGFLAGLDDRFTLTEYQDEQSGVQLNLTPIGARLVFGLPMSVLTGGIFSIADVLPSAPRFLQRLTDCATWQSRFDLIFAFLRSRLAEVPSRSKLMTCAFQRIIASQGGLDVSTLSRELGYSHKHVVTMFQDQLGMSPKMLSRLVRFDQLVQALKHGGGPWVHLATRLGFSDQAHLAREVRHFAGLTPSQLAAFLVKPIAEELKR